MTKVLKIGVVLILFLIAILLSVELGVIFIARHSIYELDNVPQESVALVLGASVSSNGMLSPVLQERADGAVTLYNQKKVQKILVSGDNSTLAHNEVYPVGKYLVSRGVPMNDIFLDYAGFDTYSSMYRAKNVFEAQSIIVTSQAFHLPRALFIAHTLGLKAIGVDVSEANDQYIQNAFREIPATGKAIFDVAIHRIPLYVGKNYPVGGDGTQTWVGSTTPVVYWAHE